MKIPPAVTPSRVDIPVAQVEPGETPVVVEDLDELHPMRSVSVDTDEGTIVVEDGLEEFAPDDTAQEDTPIEPMQLLELSEDAAASARDLPPVEDEPEEKSSLDDPELKSLVQQLVSDDFDEASRARELLRDKAEAAMVHVMKEFPGKLLLEISGPFDLLPPVEQHSALLSLLVDVGQDACAHVADLLEDINPVKRFYATFFMGRILCEKSVGRLSSRLYDRDTKVRLIAIESLQAYRGLLSYDAVLAGLRKRLASDISAQRAIAAALLGNLKDVDAVPLLVGLVKNRDRMVSRAALESLAYITKQDFGSREKKWFKWWNAHKRESRLQWLITGLSSKNRDIRFSSSQELSRITKESFGYYFDSSKSDRQKAIKRWEQWWRDEGRHLRL